MPRTQEWGGKWHVVPVSAGNSLELESASRAVGEFVADHPHVRLEDVSLTLQTRAPAGPLRRVVVARDRDDAVRLLTTGGSRVIGGHAQTTARPAIVFLCPGVGDQYLGMGAGLLKASPTFGSVVDEGFERVHALVGVDLGEALYPKGVAAHAREQAGCEHSLDLRRLLSDAPSGDALSATPVAQPTAFVVSTALAALLREFGVVPDALLGYSVGEYAAATMAAVFARAAGLEVVARRAQLVHDLAEPGAMLAVSCPSSELPRLPSGVWIATSGGPTLTVLSGRRPAIEAFAELLHAAGLVTRPLATEHAFHSPLMSPAARGLADVLGHVELSPPAVRFLSNLTGGWITDAEATDSHYWAQHLEKRVRLDRNLATLTDLRDDLILVELGPGQTLATLVVQAARARGRDVPPLARPLRARAETGDDVLVFLLALAQLWSSGATVEWKPIQRRSARPIELPS